MPGLQGTIQHDRTAASNHLLKLILQPASVTQSNCLCTQRPLWWAATHTITHTSRVVHHYHHHQSTAIIIIIISSSSTTAAATLLHEQQPPAHASRAAAL